MIAVHLSKRHAKIEMDEKINAALASQLEILQKIWSYYDNIS